MFNPAFAQICASFWDQTHRRLYLGVVTPIATQKTKKPPELLSETTKQKLMAYLTAFRPRRLENNNVVLLETVILYYLDYKVFGLRCQIAQRYFLDYCLKPKI